jgi:hypothetical protein
MFHSRITRLLAVGALAGAASLTFVGSASPVTQIVCHKLNGNIATTVTLSKCTLDATGGSSKPITATALASGGTVQWVNGKSTTVTLSVSQTEKDTGEAAAYECPTGTTEYEAKGKVTADTTGFAPVGGVAKAEACVNGTTGAITLEPHSKAIFR